MHIYNEHGLGEAHEVCFSKGDVCGPLGSSWGTVALIAFGIFLLLSFTGLLKSAYRSPSPRPVPPPRPPAPSPRPVPPPRPPAPAACRSHILIMLFEQDIS
jgi:hypothetical protein